MGFFVCLLAALGSLRYSGKMYSRHICPYGGLKRLLYAGVEQSGSCDFTLCYML